jgi:hypothetical protein
MSMMSNSDDGEYDEHEYDICDDICDDNNDYDDYDDCEDGGSDDHEDGEGDDRDDRDDRDDGEGDDREDGEGDKDDDHDGEGDDCENAELQEAGLGLTQAESAMVVRSRMTPAPPRVRLDLPAQTQDWHSQDLLKANDGAVTLVVNGMRITGSSVNLVVIMNSVNSKRDDSKDAPIHTKATSAVSEAKQDLLKMYPVVSHALSTGAPLLVSVPTRAPGTPTTGPQTRAAIPAEIGVKQSVRDNGLDETAKATVPPRALTSTERGEVVTDMQEKIAHSYSTTKSALKDERLEWKKSGERCAREAINVQAADPTHPTPPPTTPEQ